MLAPSSSISSSSHIQTPSSRCFGGRGSRILFLCIMRAASLSDSEIMTHFVVFPFRNIPQLHLDIFIFVMFNLNLLVIVFLYEY